MVGSNMSNLNEKQGLQAFRTAGLPPDFYYIPNFISAEEEASILQKVKSPAPTKTEPQHPLT
jgi:alkylated DNA repair protein alkB family protein 6